MSSAPKKKVIKILQVVGSMRVGGIETSLMHYLKNLDRELYKVDILCVDPQESIYDEEIRQLGINLFSCPKSKLWSFSRKFREILRDHGPYDIVHSHLFRFSGYVLKIARSSGVPLCIAHSHNDTPPYSGLIRRGYQKLQKKWIHRYADIKIAVSKKAAYALYGNDWHRDPGVKIIHLGQDFSAFETTVNPALARKEFGIPLDAFVIGHVGRFHPQKNHPFLLEIAAEVFRRHPNSRLLLVGEGELKREIEAKASALGIADKVIFAGLRMDIPRLMMGAMDAFLLPSFFEGLPIVMIEAQAAGLPCIISDVISEEADLVQPLITRLSLEQSAGEWAEAALKPYRTAPEINRREALTIIQKSDFSINNYLQNLESVYRSIDASNKAESSSRNLSNLNQCHNKKPIRILQVIGDMRVGGIETVLMNVLRNLDSNEFQTDFLYANPIKKSPYDTEILNMGCRVFYCRRGRFWSFSRNFRKILREQGPYDIVHAHFFRFNGYIMKLAKACGVPIRIAHCHSASPHYQNFFLRIYQSVLIGWIWKYSTLGLAVSGDAATALFGPEWQTDNRFNLIYCGVCLKPFQEKISKEEVRQEFGIPPEALVVGHVGRICEVKNHKFLLDVFSEISRRHPQAQLLLVGAGDLKPEIEAKAEALGISDKIIFTGVRFDVARLMLGAMDIFIFPSIYEGLASAITEAQASGLPCVISDSIPVDVDLVKPLITRLSLKQSAEEWAATALRIYNKKPEVTRRDAFEIIQNSYLNMDNYIKSIEACYRGKFIPPDSKEV